MAVKHTTLGVLRYDNVGFELEDDLFLQPVQWLEFAEIKGSAHLRLL